MKKKEENQNTATEVEELYKIEADVKPLDTSASKKITFKSYHRGSLVFITPDKYIRFINHLYTTDDEEVISYLREHPMFGQEFFEGDFPDWVKEKIQKDKQHISYFNPDEEVTG